MASISEAFELARMGNSEAATDMLRQEFERLRRPESMVELCEWLAECFEKFQDYGQAGSWYQTAGELILSDEGSVLPIKAIRAVREYEKALECYHRTEDAAVIDRCSGIIIELKHLCVCA